MALVLAILGASAVLVFLDARRAEAHLRSSVTTVQKVRAGVLSGDRKTVEPAMTQLQEQTAAAVSATQGPHWWIAAHTPVVGESVAAVQTLAGVVDDLANDALPALADAVKVLDPSVLLPRGGQINTRPFIDVAPRVIAADDAVGASAARLAAIDEAHVIDRVAGPVTELKTMVRELGGTTQLASRAAQLIPPMLGAYGARQYILLAQSPAEIRATGGHPGAVMLVTVDDGRVTLGERLGVGSLTSTTPVVPLTPQEDLLFSDRLVTFGGNGTLTPDFPRTAEITRAQWQKAFGVQVDGVLSLDPVALGYVLGATGPVSLPDGTTLTSSNAAPLLLNEIYRTLAPDQQDDLFGDAAKTAFEALMQGGPDVSASLSALTRAADEGRWLLWSSDPAEQAVLAGTPLAGELVGEIDGAPVVGVFLNDASATKMSYYLDYPVQVRRTACLAGGVRQLTVTVDVTSTAPAEAAGYPASLSGGGQVTPGHSLTNVLVYTPARGRIEQVTVDGAEYGAMGLYRHGDMEVAQVTLDLAPGDSRRLDVVLNTGDQSDVAQLHLTPGSRSQDQLVEDSTC